MGQVERPAGYFQILNKVNWIIWCPKAGVHNLRPYGRVRPW